MSHSGLNLPGLVRSLLVRADMTQLDKTAPPGPREDRRPLRVLQFPAKNRLDAGSSRLGTNCLGEGVCEPRCRLESGAGVRSGPLHVRSASECHYAGTLSASDDGVTPLNANLAVLIDRGPGFKRKSHAPQEITTRMPEHNFLFFP